MTTATETPDGDNKESTPAETSSEHNSEENTETPTLSSEEKERRARVDRRNAELARDKKALEEKVSQYETKLKELDDGFKDNKIEALNAELEELRTRLSQKDFDLVKTKFVTATLEGVAPEKLEQAKLMVAGLLSEEAIELGADSDPNKLAKKARKTLAERFPDLYKGVDMPSNVQTSPDASFKSAKTLSDVPRDQWSKLSDAEFKRLTLGGAQGNDPII